MRVLDPRDKENTFLRNCEFTLIWEDFKPIYYTFHMFFAWCEYNNRIMRMSCCHHVRLSITSTPTPHLHALVLGMYRADIKV
jgi:hypothetical protein